MRLRWGDVISHVPFKHPSGQPVPEAESVVLFYFFFKGLQVNPCLFRLLQYGTSFIPRQAYSPSGGCFESLTHFSHGTSFSEPYVLRYVVVSKRS